MKTTLLPIGSIKPNKKNPRTISATGMARLVDSIRKHPWMLRARPLLVDGNNTVLGGNQRLEAARQAGLDMVPVLYVSDMSAAERKALVIRDNVTYGEWDWDKLANEWEMEELSALGVDGNVFVPEIQPSQNGGIVKKAEVQKAEEDMKQKMKKPDADVKEIMCPCCGKAIRFTV